MGTAFTTHLDGTIFVGVKWDRGSGIGSNAHTDLTILELPKPPKPDVVIKASEITFNEGVLRLAAVHGRRVEFRYAKSPASPVEFRSFVPEAVTVTSAGHTVVGGDDPDRDGEYRAYRLDRIKGEVSIP